MGKIADYYRRSHWLYKYFWYSQKSLGLHFGFWFQSTKTKDEAIINQYRYVIDRAKISRGMRVLDAGCGVGGGAIYIAKQTGALVNGVTIVAEQAKEAERNARKAHVAVHVRFEKSDYSHTNFPEKFFDVVFAMESACYSYPKSLFLKEAYRVLKPGGVLVITDGYCRRRPKNRYEESVIAKFCRGWRLQELCVYSGMTTAMKNAKFDKITVEDMTAIVRPTLGVMRRLVNLAKPAMYLAKYLTFLPMKIIEDNVVSIQMLWEADKLELFGYFAHTAEKPGK